MRRQLRRRQRKENKCKVTVLSAKPQIHKKNSNLNPALCPFLYITEPDLRCRTNSQTVDWGGGAICAKS